MRAKLTILGENNESELKTGMHEEINTIKNAFGFSKRSV